VRGLRRRELVAAAAAACGLAACTQLPERATAPARLRIGFVSCADQTRPQPLWDALLADAPDFVVFGGDNVYASEQPFALEKLRAAYEQAGRIESLRRLRERVPHLAVWDDHDYGLNDGGAEFAHRQASKDEFMRFWRLPADDPRRSRDGLYHAVTLRAGERRVQVIGLDTRWFRSPLKPTDQRGAQGKERYLPDDDPAKTMLGETQWDWLEARLRDGADVNLVVSSVQLVVDGHGFERWGNLPRERRRFYRLLTETGARGAVVLSGDRHIGAIYRETGASLPYPLHEITSSGVTHPWREASEPGPNRIGPLVTELHHALIDIDAVERTLTLSLRGIDGRTLLSHRLSFTELGITRRDAP
jgi:alkaline phosphatase D